MLLLFCKCEHNEPIWLSPLFARRPAPAAIGGFFVLHFAISYELTLHPPSCMLTKHNKLLPALFHWLIRCMAPFLIRQLQAVKRANKLVSRISSPFKPILECESPDKISLSFILTAQKHLKKRRFSPEMGLSAHDGVRSGQSEHARLC